MTLVVRERLRSALSPRYRWWKHALLLVMTPLGTAATALLGLHDVRAWELGVGAGMLLLANFVEYVLHRWPFHRPRLGSFTYRLHTGVHHAFFSDDMVIARSSDLRWVMFPWWGFPALLVAVSPLWFLARAYASPNAMWLMLLAACAYYLGYEFFHAAVHLPPGHALRRLWAVRAAARHHLSHHEPTRMAEQNFNFALPLFDLLFGTLHRPPRGAFQVAIEPPGRVFARSAGLAGAGPDRIVPPHAEDR